MMTSRQTQQRRAALKARFASRLRKTRADNHVTQAELAGAIGVEPSQISRFETGVAEPTFSQAILIFDRLEQPSDLRPLPNGEMRIGFYSRDADGGVVDVDSETLACCGLPPDAPGELVWQNWFDRIHHDDRDAVAAELARLQIDGVFAMRYRIVGYDGIERVIVDHGRTSCVDGRPRRLNGMMVDVTHRNADDVARLLGTLPL